MTTIADQRSIVGIDPTSRGLAFVFFEGGELLDWGTRRNDGNEEHVLDRLLDTFKADVLVVENGDAPRSERRPRVRRLLRQLRERAQSRGTAVLGVSRYNVREKWAKRGFTRKHAVAGAIAEMFPEVEMLVPRKRKLYRSEEARTDIFDAISLVLQAFPAEASDEDGSPSEQTAA
jgi:hypothetical protein